jgi:hypothetical protein
LKAKQIRMSKIVKSRLIATRAISMSLDHLPRWFYTIGGHWSLILKLCMFFFSCVLVTMTMMCS